MRTEPVKLLKTDGWGKLSNTGDLSVQKVISS